MPRQAPGQVCLFHIGGAHPRYAIPSRLQRRRGGFEDEADSRIWKLARIENSDRCSIAVADQYRAFDAHLTENLGKRSVRFPIHISDSSRSCKGNGVVFSIFLRSLNRMR